MASSVEIASKALEHLINSVFVEWAGRTPDPSTHLTVLLRQLMRNLVVWFNKVPPAFEALEAYYLSCDATKLPAFLMFVWIGAMSGGLASMERTRDIAEDLEDDLCLWMNRMAKASADQQTHQDKINRGVVQKMAARVLDRLLVLDKADLAKGIDAVTVVAPIPATETAIQKDIILIANYATKVLILAGNPETNRIALRNLRIFAAGSVSSSDSESDVEAPGTPPTDSEALEAIEGYKKLAAEALARAVGAEQIAEAAEQRVSAAEKKVAALEKRMASFEKTVAAMDKKLAAADHRALKESSIVATLTDKVATVIKDVCTLRTPRTPRTPPVIQMTTSPQAPPPAPPPPPPPAPAPPPPAPAPPPPPPPSNAALSALQATSADHTATLKKLVAEMGWIMPQFRMMFFERWNGVMAQWQLQQQYATSHVPASEFERF